MRSLLIVTLLAAPAFALDDEPIDHLQMGRRLIDSEHYLEALKELELAYALRQQPVLLFEMARAQHRLGQADKALELYRRYLVADDGDAARRREAEAKVRSLAPMTAHDSPPAPTRARYETRRNTGLMIAGIVLLGASYLPVFVTASYGLSLGAENETAALATLYLPVLGPFISAGLHPELGWSLPMTIVDGMAQALGFSMMVAGALTKKRVLVVEQPTVSVAPTSLPGGAGLVAFGRF